MSRPASERARHLAGELELRFARDAELAGRLSDAHERLLRANDRLWCGLHPDGMATLHGEHPAAVEVAFAEHRSEALCAPDPLQAIQRAHWQIHRAHRDYQDAAEERRQLAVDVGEITRGFVDELVASGWSEQEARNANVPDLASPRRRV